MPQQHHLRDFSIKKQKHSLWISTWKLAVFSTGDTSDTLTTMAWAHLTRARYASTTSPVSWVCAFLGHRAPSNPNPALPSPQTFHYIPTISPVPRTHRVPPLRDRKSLGDKQNIPESVPPLRAWQAGTCNPQLLQKSGAV